MFEKEAKNWVKEHTDIDYKASYGEFPIEPSAIKSFKSGAEFGYNKANEWHKVADGDLPKENKLYLVAIKDNGLAIAYFNGRHWETKFNLGDFGHCVETVIAWKEIVFPKEIAE